MSTSIARSISNLNAQMDETMPHTTKSFRLASAVFFCATFLSHVGHAENTASQYAAKPVRLLVPSPAGGAADSISRAIARKLSDTWGQQVIVDNRGGAAGAIALDLTAKAPADGYTILLLSASHTIDAALNPKGYALTKDFAAVSQASSHFLTLYHHPTLKVGSVSELIANAKANPGKLAFGSAGTGSVQHLAWELFAHMAGVKLMHVPYKGGAHAMTAALSSEGIYIAHERAAARLG